MIEIDINVENDNIPKELLTRWAREAVRSGCETKEEIKGYLLHRHNVRVVSSKKIDFAPDLWKMIPWIVDTLDKKFERGEKLNFVVKARDFLLEMGGGSRKYTHIGYIRVASSIRSTLLSQGINIVSFKSKGEGHYLFYALSEQEAESIEKRIQKNYKKVVCKKMVKTVCENGLYNEDAHSIWKDVEFIKNIGRCAFDAKKIEDDIQRKKDILMFESAKDGIALLFSEFYDGDKMSDEMSENQKLIKTFIEKNLKTLENGWKIYVANSDAVEKLKVKEVMTKFKNTLNIFEREKTFGDIKFECGLEKDKYTDNGDRLIYIKLRR